MNKSVLGLAIMGALTLSACGGGGGSSPADPVVPPGEGSIPRTKAIFETTDANCDGYTIPTPNDLVFLGSTDLTLNIPAPSAACANAPAYSASKLALQQQLSNLDGWSAAAPFVIKFANNDASVKLDPATVEAGKSLRIFKVALNRPEIAPGIPAPTGAVTSIESELTANTDYKLEIAADDATGMTVRVQPMKPFSPQSSYMVVLTNGIKDTKGNAAITDTTYGVVKQTAPLTDPQARSLQQLVNAQEAAAAGKGIASADIIMSYVFTVQSVNEVLNTVHAYDNSPAVSAASAFALAGPQNLLPIGAAASAPGAANAIIYLGQLTVPYFLTATSASVNPATGTITDATPINSYWKASTASPLGVNLSYANPLPAATGNETIPALLSVPSPAVPSCAKPYPIVIFQHGITRNRTDMFGLSATLANQCFATVAIDQPMHGIDASFGPLFQGYSTTDGNGPLRERTFGLDLLNNTTGALGSPDGVVDPSGSWFINLANLLNTRDNLRQASSDLFTLTKAIGSMDYDHDGQPDFDSDHIYFVGQSLGSIVGSTFVAFEPKIKAAVLSVPGGGLAKLLDGSKSFGPRIRAGLAANGVVAGSSDYESFLFAAQTAVDAGDPINTAAASVARGVPVLVHEVVGGLGGSPSDLVIPNSVVKGTELNPVTGTDYTIYSDGPLGGGNPIVEALGLTSISSTTQNPNGIRGVVRFVAGAHGSLLAPDASLDPQGTVTAEMQTEMVSFLKTNGAAVQVVNSNVVQP